MSSISGNMILPGGIGWIRAVAASSRASVAHLARGGRDQGGSRRRPDPLRPHRIPAEAAGQPARTPSTVRCARSGSRSRPGRSCASSPTISTPPPRRSEILQAPLGHRAVLPLGQAEPQNPQVPRHQRERRPHPAHRRPDRLPAAQAIYAAIKPAYSFLAFTRLVQGHLMELARIDRLLPDLPADQTGPKTQLSLQWT